MVRTFTWHLASVSMWKRGCQGKTQTYGSPVQRGLLKTNTCMCTQKPGAAGTAWIGFLFPCHIAVRQITAGGGADSSALPHNTPYKAKPQSHGRAPRDGRLSFQLPGSSNGNLSQGSWTIMVHKMDSSPKIAKTTDEPINALQVTDREEKEGKNLEK